MMEATIILREILRTHRLAPGRTRPEKPRARQVVYAPSRGGRIIAHPR
jgi:hypothetical protein